MLLGSLGALISPLVQFLLWRDVTAHVLIIYIINILIPSSLHLLEVFQVTDGTRDQKNVIFINIFIALCLSNNTSCKRIIEYKHLNIQQILCFVLIYNICLQLSEYYTIIFVFIKCLLYHYAFHLYSISNVLIFYCPFVKLCLLYNSMPCHYLHG